MEPPPSGNKDSPDFRDQLQQGKEPKRWATSKIFQCTPGEFRTLVQHLTGPTSSGDKSSAPNIVITGSSERERTSTTEMVLKWLDDPTISIIGIYGMEGVGKTTLATHIQDQLRNHAKYFVSWVNVSQNFAIDNLQDDIARTVNLDLWDEDDKEKRKEKLKRALEEKNIVLMLDNVWTYIPLQDVGIPNGCKLIFMTRNVGVCHRMNCQGEILINRLSNEEGWELFMEKIGPTMVLPPLIEQIAMAIVKECSGSPLAIVTMAANMKGVGNFGEWRYALERIKEKKVLQNGITISEEYRVLRYCYEKFKDPNVQQCLLYCAFYPEEFKIDREMLIENFVDAGLIDGKNREEELNNGHAVLDKLENAFLLEGGTSKYGKRYVKMSSIVKGFILNLSSIRWPSNLQEENS